MSLAVSPPDVWNHQVYNCKIIFIYLICWIIGDDVYFCDDHNLMIYTLFSYKSEKFNSLELNLSYFVIDKAKRIN